MGESVDLVVFRGVKFRRYLDAPGGAERRYYVPGISDRQRGVKRLHEEIWMASNGPIPAGHHVHHRDHDHLNNDLANLDCITDEEHRQYHVAERHESGAYIAPARLQHLERIRPLASSWHSSDAGRAWHAEHGSRSWDERVPDERSCDQCGGSYFSRSRKGNERYCSARCRAAARRASGVDDEDRCCQHCSETFRANKYSRMRFCSRSCSSRYTAAARREGTA